MRKIALAGGMLLDGTGAAPYAGTLILSAGKIESIATDNPNVEAIDITGCTVLPGFVHAHAHPGFKQLAGQDLPDYELPWLEACLAAGVTTVRDMGALSGSSLDAVLQRRDALNAAGNTPRIASPGKFLSAPGGYGGISPIAITSEREARQAVRHAHHAGVDFIKTSLELGYSPDTALPTLTPELLRAICEEARSLGLQVAAHLSQSGPLRTLVEAGITNAEHAPYDRMDDELIALMIERSVMLTPTLTMYRMFQEKFGAPFLATAMENTQRFAAAGGRIAVGDDYLEPEEPWYKPGLPFGELELLRQAGLSPLQLITALTKNGAAACGLASVTGTLEPGKAADVVVVRGDPLEDLNALKDVRMVINRGTVITQA